MTDHIWVSMQYHPIIVEVQLDGSLDVSAEVDSIQISEEQAVMACWFCHTPLNTYTYATECSPEKSLDPAIDTPPDRL